MESVGEGDWRSGWDRPKPRPIAAPRPSAGKRGAEPSKRRSKIVQGAIHYNAALLLLWRPALRRPLGRPSKSGPKFLG